MAPYGADGRFSPCHCEASSPCLPLRGNCGFALPVADEAKPEFPQWSKNASKRMCAAFFGHRKAEVAAAVPRKAADGRGLRRGTDSGSSRAPTPTAQTPVPRRGRRPRRPALPPPPGEGAAAVPRKAADGRGRRRMTDKRAVEGASPYGADGHFPPCHCEPVTDVTGVAIRFLRSRRGGACPSRKHRRGTDKRAGDTRPYGADPRSP